MRIVFDTNVLVRAAPDRHFSHPDLLPFLAANGLRVVSDVELLQELRSAGSAAPEARPR